MYLQQLRHLDVKPGKWPGQSDVMMLNACFDIADATLNSWKEAHDAFNARVKIPDDPKQFGQGVHQQFTRLVVKAFKKCEDAGMRSFATNKFPSETLAYAVLVAWIENEEADKCPTKSES